MILPPRLIPATFVVLWATGFVTARYAMPWMEPFTFLAIRFFLACLILWPVARARGALRLTPRQVAQASVAGALMHGIYLAGVFWSVRQGLPAGMVAVIVGLQPLITALIAGASLGERVLPRHWLGLAIGFAGVVVILLPKLGAGIDAVTLPMLAAAFVAVAGMSAGTVWQKRTGGGADLIAATCCQYAGATVLMAVAALLFEERTVVLNAPVVLTMAWSVLVLSIGAIGLLMILIREGAMAKVASLFYLVPGVTALMAWALLGETLTPVQVGGMVVAAAGVALATAQPPTRARASR